MTNKGRVRLLRSLFLLIIGHRKFLRVSGDSMLPTLRQGDTVIYRTTQNSKITLRKGLIIIVRSPIDPSILIIKRLHEQSQLGLDIRGDNEICSIDSRIFGLVHHNNLHGVVDQIIPGFNLQATSLKQLGQRR